VFLNRAVRRKLIGRILRGATWAPSSRSQVKPSSRNNRSRSALCKASSSWRSRVAGARPSSRPHPAQALRRSPAGAQRDVRRWRRAVRSAPSAFPKWLGLLGL